MERSASPIIGNFTSILFSQWATTLILLVIYFQGFVHVPSLSHSLWDLTGSTERVATRQSISVNLSYFSAKRPISVVHTGYILVG